MQQLQKNNLDLQTKVNELESTLSSLQVIIIKKDLIYDLLLNSLNKLRIKERKIQLKNRMRG